jgi:hypothetical protein
LAKNNNSFFRVYQYISPLVLTPLSFWLWNNTYNGNLVLVLMAWLVPILFAYIVPGVGTNILGVWEFNTKFRLGKFRPHHGFVFGSATSIIIWVCHRHIAHDLMDVVVFGIVAATVLGSVNFFYDLKAIESGFLKVYNQPWADGKGPVEITIDYAPWTFGGFGFIYGMGIALSEILFFNWSGSSWLPFLYFVLFLIISIIFPIIGYRNRSFKAHGHSGLQPIKPDAFKNKIHSDK